MAEIDQTKLWYQPNLDVFLNRWFADYEAARAALDSEGGFLFPYQKHYFVCQPDVVAALGLDPHDSDWEKIGRDCVRPDDTEAYQRLYQKREQIVREAMGG
ncbi:MAG TPA: hypothetical protein VLN44_09950 [Pyrinomonadaceae bacterium]|nr:hypothetical protein [Pyrinomonadaceae bacterium]